LEEYMLSEEEEAYVEKLALDKYAKDEWNYRR
jgi:lipoate-protein ligase A